MFVVTNDLLQHNRVRNRRKPAQITDGMPQRGSVADGMDAAVMLTTLGWRLVAGGGGRVVVGDGNGWHLR